MQQGNPCPNCGSPVNYGQRFCGVCGAPQSSGCAYCGNPLDPNARFCASCGAQAGGGQQQPQPGWGQQQPGWGQQPPQPGWGQQQPQPGWGQQQAGWGSPAPGTQTGPSRGLLLVLLFILLIALGGFIYWQFGSRFGNILSFLNISGPGASSVDTTTLEIADVQASVAGTTALIQWETTKPASSQVEYGNSDTYGTLEPAEPKNNPSTGESMGVVTHTVELTGLQTGSTYHYRVKSIDQTGNEVISPDDTFEVPVPPPPESEE